MTRHFPQVLRKSERVMASVAVEHEHNVHPIVKVQPDAGTTHSLYVFATFRPLANMTHVVIATFGYILLCFYCGKIFQMFCCRLVASTTNFREPRTFDGFCLARKESHSRCQWDRFIFNFVLRIGHCRVRVHSF